MSENCTHYFVERDGVESCVVCGEVNNVNEKEQSPWFPIDTIPRDRTPVFVVVSGKHTFSGEYLECCYAFADGDHLYSLDEYDMLSSRFVRCSIKFDVMSDDGGWKLTHWTYANPLVSIGEQMKNLRNPACYDDNKTE